MLWSDPPDEPPEDIRQVQAMLRRAIIVIAVVVPVVMAIAIGLRP
ncbi:hypothetical protein [Actinacidiphila oryziradicis]|jgi:uncharacterized protein involved in exopolysaccharide biosynthesis|nr:hypothetical protein [Actinacidiphila oryziradicis]MCW2874527.1 hypothetical protein [Actinacidiphila oryziradicis]